MCAKICPGCCAVIGCATFPLWRKEKRRRRQSANGGARSEDPPLASLRLSCLPWENLFPNSTEKSSIPIDVALWEKMFPLNSTERYSNQCCRGKTRFPLTRPRGFPIGFVPWENLFPVDSTKRFSNRCCPVGNMVPPNSTKEIFQSVLPWENIALGNLVSP